MIDQKKLIEVSKIKKIIEAALCKSGMNNTQAKITANHMVYADLRGIDTHGILRLPIYVKRIREGLINVHSKYNWENESNNSITLDSDNGIGHYSAHIGMEKAIEKAKENTIGLVFVKNGNHYGAASSYTNIAARKGFIGFTTTNTAPLMPPTGGAEKILGSNPISFSVPRESHKPIILDIACSNVAQGKLVLAEQKGESIPEGWAVDKDGNPTTDPHAGSNTEGGSLLPVGAHKGYGLALIMDILAGVLSGASYGKDVSSLYNLNETVGTGFVMMAININHIMPMKLFNPRLEDLISMIVNSKTAVRTNRIYLPGEIEEKVKEERDVTGIPINKSLYKELRIMAKELDISFNL